MAQARTRRVRSDSPAEMVKRLANPDGSIEPPEGIELETEELRTIWKQFSQARAASDWRAMDLVLLAKVVRLEAKVRECERLISQSGMLVENARGTMVKNPLIDVQDTYSRQMLAVIRSMSLGTNGQDARTLNSNGKLQQEDTQKLKSVGAGKLLAL